MKRFFARLGAFLTGVRVWTINIFTLLILVYVVGAVVYLVRQMPETVDPGGKVLIIAPEAMQKTSTTPSSLFSFTSGSKPRSGPDINSSLNAR